MREQRGRVHVRPRERAGGREREARLAAGALDAAQGATVGAGPRGAVGQADHAVDEAQPGGGCGGQVDGALALAGHRVGVGVGDGVAGAGGVGIAPCFDAAHVAGDVDAREAQRRGAQHARACRRGRVGTGLPAEVDAVVAGRVEDARRHVLQGVGGRALVEARHAAAARGVRVLDGVAEGVFHARQEPRRRLVGGEVVAPEVGGTVPARVLVLPLHGAGGRRGAAPGPGPAVARGLPGVRAAIEDEVAAIVLLEAVDRPRGRGDGVVEALPVDVGVVAAVHPGHAAGGRAQLDPRESREHHGVTQPAVGLLEVDDDR